jgi:hypothetical protein
MQHANTGHNLGAENCECEVKDRKAILRLYIKPVDRNQRMDESYLHEQKLVSMSLNDTTIIKGLREYFSSRKPDFETWELQLISQKKILNFAVIPKLSTQSTHQTLTLSTV